MSAKMDGVYPRTPSQLNQEFRFGKTFAELMGIATDAQSVAKEAKESVGNLDEGLTSEGIYNRLTNNGTLQGLYRDESGNLYVNAEYIVALEKLFTKDINMSGTFTHKANIFLEPEEEEVKKIKKHLLRTEIIPVYDFPLYDFNNDGNITLIDMAKCQNAVLGIDSLADWSGAKTSEVTLTINLSSPDKCIRIQGVNMWGRAVDKYIGVNGTNIKNSAIADFIVESGTAALGDVNTWYYEKWNSGKAVCRGELTCEDVAIETQWGSLYESTNFQANYPEGLFAHAPQCFAEVSSDTGYGVMKEQSGYGTAETTPAIFFVRPSPMTVSSAIIHFVAIGRWN